MSPIYYPQIVGIVDWRGIEPILIHKMLVYYLSYRRKLDRIKVTDDFTVTNNFCSVPFIL